MSRPPPRYNLLQSSAVGNGHHAPVPGYKFQHSPPRNKFPTLPLGNRFQSTPIGGIPIPPPSLYLSRQPPPSNLFQPPPLRNVFQQPRPTNGLQHPPVINVQQPPPISMFRQPPPVNVQPTLPSLNTLRRPPPPSTMTPPCMSEPPPGFLRRPPPTTNPQPSLRSGFGDNASQISPRLRSMQSPLRPMTPVVVPPSARPVSLPSEDHVSPMSGNRLHSLPRINDSDPLVSKPNLPGQSMKTAVGGVYTNAPIPLMNSSYFSVPPPAAMNIDVSLSTPGSACTISPLATSPSTTSLATYKTFSHISVGGQPENIAIRNSSSLIEIPRHPLNNNWVSITKLQSNVDEWASKKFKLEVNVHEAFNEKNASSCYGQSDSSVKHVTSCQQLDELRKILEERSFNEKTRELVISVLPLLNRQYRNFRLQDVHSCVAAYTLLLTELRGASNATRASDVKKLLDPIKGLLADCKFQDVVKQLVSARTRKRQRKKKRRVLLREEWRLKGELIDARNERLRKLEQQKIQEVKLRSEADAVLKEVRNKQEEAESMQSLLWTLRDLRQHRLNRGEQQGYVSSQLDDESFTRVADGLEKMIETQLSDYALEERTLLAMLQTSHHPPPASTPTSKSPAADFEALSSAITETLFGASAPRDPALCASYCAADTSLEMLVSRRRAWDKHIVSHPAAPGDGGSGVPVCWVLPPDRPSLPWRRYQAS